MTRQTLLDERGNVRDAAPSVGESCEPIFSVQIQEEGPCNPDVDSGPNRDYDIIEFWEGEQLDVPFLLDAAKLEGEVPDFPRTYVRVNRIGGGEIHGSVRGT